MAQFERVSLSKEEIKASHLLRQTRLAQGLSLAQIAHDILIKEEYLEYLEKGEYNKLPSGVYIVNFFKEYARRLGLDPNKLVASFKSEMAASHIVASDVYERKVVERKYFLVIPRLVKYFMLALAGFLFIGYLVWLIANIYLPPKLKILYPPESSAVTTSKIQVTGQAERETQITINDQPVVVSADGEFELWVNLKQGLNNIEIRGTKKNKREQIIKREVLYEAPEQPQP
ncbi:MAG: helix-turn-helix domain-containing protein [Candidatus Falkowbacteria bacterium]